MVVIPDRASRRNNFHIIPLARPRIERERDADGLARAAPRAAMAGLSAIVERRCASSQGSSSIERSGRHERRRQPGGTKLLRTILQKWKGAR